VQVLVELLVMVQVLVEAVQEDIVLLSQVNHQEVEAVLKLQSPLSLKVIQ